MEIYTGDDGQTAGVALTVGSAEVNIRNNYNGVHFKNGGERLTIVERDSGFEIHYYGHRDGGVTGPGMIEFDLGRIDLKLGQVLHYEKINKIAGD